MNISSVLLLCLLCVQGAFPVHIEDADTVEYLNKLGEAVWEELQDYGLSNLPDGDVKMFFNKTLFAGYNITGYLYLEDGFVMDMETVLATNLENHAVVRDEVAEVESHLLLKGISILRDFRYVPIVPLVTNDTTSGSVIITPKRLYINFKVEKNLTDDTMAVSMFYGGSEPGSRLLHFNPLNGLTKRLNQLHALSEVDNGQLFLDMHKLWKDTFKKFLEAAVQKVEFPTIRFQTSRGNDYSRFAYHNYLH
ncbi:hypothetical protein KM043_005543 [Ampulex compressa]|nr:hypothetical protein KM043_005543 [Ampulex compressa]